MFTISVTCPQFWTISCTMSIISDHLFISYTMSGVPDHLLSHVCSL
ncbi:unnamed protein product [Staurois parvus]|uniref:Uncharacterized protein n=1 Tax=Staurois parvus TaxID=386267 RepID=A0ABN9G3Q6_9NEOB|nr:unnamed protein product [Staurois parvus]